MSWISERFASVRIPPRRTLLCLCGLLLFGLWLAQVHPYLSVANDAGRYMVLGESLAQTGDLRLINAVNRPRDTLYPPGFPALIALWLRVTGRDPVGVILFVKATQLAFALVTLPFLLILLQRARLPFGYQAAALLTAALCPALANYANEVMSEMPFLFLCLAAIALADLPPPALLLEEKGSGHSQTPSPPSDEAQTEQDREPLRHESELTGGKSEGEGVPPPSPFPARAANAVGQEIGRLGLALFCAAAAFLTRTAGLALLVVLPLWFLWRYGWRWGVVAACVSLGVVWGWQARNAPILAHPPPGFHYETYLEQFTLRDPSNPSAGRITLDGRGLQERLRTGVAAYIGMTPRALLQRMPPPGSAQARLFTALAVPMTVLILIGWGVAIRRGMWLTAGFSLLFWLMAALWPWRNPRFLVPLVPYLILFLFLGAAWIAAWLEPRIGVRAVRMAQAAAFIGLLIYFGAVHLETIRRERPPIPSGYPAGRSTAEGGFYAACAWIRQNAPAGALVMGRPPYLLYLYCRRPTTQIEPVSHPGTQEALYIKKQGVRYLVEDAWNWSRTRRYLGPYLRQFRNRWRLVWEDPNGSGTRVWERKAR